MSASRAGGSAQPDVHERWARGIICALTGLDDNAVETEENQPRSPDAVPGTGAQDSRSGGVDLVLAPLRAAERGLNDDAAGRRGKRVVFIRSLAVLRSKHADTPYSDDGEPPR